MTNISDTPVGLEYISSFSYHGIDKDTTMVFIPHNTWTRESGWQDYTLPELGMECINGLLRHNRAYLAWIDEIKSKYPDLLVENCSSGGLRADYAMLAHHHILSATDRENYKYIGCDRNKITER